VQVTQTSCDDYIYVIYDSTKSTNIPTPTSGADSAGTVSESELANSSHSDIDELIQRIHELQKTRLGLSEHMSQRRLHSVKCQ